MATKDDNIKILVGCVVGMTALGMIPFPANLYFDKLIRNLFFEYRDEYVTEESFLIDCSKKLEDYLKAHPDIIKESLLNRLSNITQRQDDREVELNDMLNFLDLDGLDGEHNEDD